jgi:hypothetical protein
MSGLTSQWHGNYEPVCGSFAMAPVGGQGYLQHPVEQIRAGSPIRSDTSICKVLINKQIKLARDWHARCNTLC